MGHVLRPPRAGAGPWKADSSAAPARYAHLASAQPPGNTQETWVGNFSQSRVWSQLNLPSGAEGVTGRVRKRINFAALVPGNSSTTSKFDMRLTRKCRNTLTVFGRSTFRKRDARTEPRLRSTRASVTATELEEVSRGQHSRACATRCRSRSRARHTRRAK